jgi:hypothetical protein
LLWTNPGLLVIIIFSTDWWISFGARMRNMANPFASRVVLSEELHQTLKSLALARSTPQALAFRCRLVLRAAEPSNPTNPTIAGEFDCDRHTVGLWRERFVKQGLTGLQDAPRSGRPRKFSPRGTAARHHIGQQ